MSFSYGQSVGWVAVLLGDDQPGPALGAGRVVRGVLLGGSAVARVVGEVSAEHDAVARRHRAELQGSPQVPVGHSGATLPTAVSRGHAEGSRIVAAWKI